MSDLNNLYPLTVFKTRYQGTYEGGKWVAFNEHLDSELLDGAVGDDSTCAGFFYMYERFKPYGRGDTAQEAVEDLKNRMWGT